MVTLKCLIGKHKFFTFYCLGKRICSFFPLKFRRNFLTQPGWVIVYSIPLAFLFLTTTSTSTSPAARPKSQVKCPTHHQVANLTPKAQNRQSQLVNSEAEHRVALTIQTRRPIPKVQNLQHRPAEKSALTNVSFSPVTHTTHGYHPRTTEAHDSDSLTDTSPSQSDTMTCIQVGRETYAVTSQPGTSYTFDPGIDTGTFQGQRLQPVTNPDGDDYASIVVIDSSEPPHPTHPGKKKRLQLRVRKKMNTNATNSDRTTP